MIHVTIPENADLNEVGETLPPRHAKIEAAKAKRNSLKKEKNEEHVFDFFKVKCSAEGDFKDVNILQTGFLDLLRREGFRRYDTNETFILVRIQDNIIEEVYIHHLRAWVTRYFHKLPAEVYDTWYNACPKAYLYEKLLRSLATLTSPEKLSLLVDMDDELQDEIVLVEDEKDKAFYFYQNGFVEVTAAGVKLRPYSELPGYVWKDQIIPRDFAPLALPALQKGVYWQFACNVSENWPNDKGQPNNPRRFQSFLTITGYNLHRFFKQKLRATIFLDGRISDDPDGRSGKSLHTKAMQNILNASSAGKQAIVIDGKRYDEDNRFAFDELHVSTKLVVFDDLKRGFQIESFFNAIVDGLVRERKGDMNKIKILAKIIFTLNYTIQIRGGSAKDRVVEFEFADYYSSQRTPEMEFGHWFFRDWDGHEWARFDAFMMHCVEQYFRHGLILPETIHLEARKLKDETCTEFITFMEELEIVHEKSYNQKELFEQFQKAVDAVTNGIVRKEWVWLTQRKFTQFLKFWAQYRPEIAGFRKYRSSGADFIRFFHNLPVNADYLDVGATNVEVVLFPGKRDKVKPYTLADAPAASDLPTEPPF